MVPVDVIITNDGVFEQLETFTVSLVRDPADPVNVVVINPDAATVSIQDEDGKVITLCRNCKDMVHLSVCLSVCLSVYPSVCLFACLHSSIRNTYLSNKFIFHPYSVMPLSSTYL